MNFRKIKISKLWNIDSVIWDKIYEYISKKWNLFFMEKNLFQNYFSEDF